MKPKFLVDEAITDRDAFTALGPVRTYATTPKECDSHWNPDALVIRSVTSIGMDCLAQFPSLSHVFTGTAGYDHIDMGACVDNGVQVWNAPGHNAEAVADWVWTVLFQFSVEENRPLSGLRMGIVGAGHTGSAVAKRAAVHGVEVLSYDPPRSAEDASFLSCSWEEILRTDILSFHVPLVREGDWPTVGMLSPGDVKERRWLINASRGDVFNFSDEAKVESKNLIALDVFPGEPSIAPSLVRLARLASPHVGGNTHAAKKNATRMLLEKASELYGIPLPPEASDTQRFGDSAATCRLVNVRKTMSVEEAFAVIANGIHGLADLFKEFRSANAFCTQEESETVFKEFRLKSRRRSFQRTPVSFESGPEREWEQAFKAHGIQVVGRERALLHVKGTLPIFEA